MSRLGISTFLLGLVLFSLMGLTTLTGQEDEENAEFTISALGLTEAEKQWLKTHPTVRFGDDFSIPPSIFQDDNGNVAGISSGYLELLAERLGMEFMPRFGLDKDIRIAATTSYLDDLAIGVRKDWPELVSILDNALASISHREKAAIENYWLGVSFPFGAQARQFLRWVVLALVIGLVVIVLVVLWNGQLRRNVQARTMEIAENEARYRSVIDDSPLLVCTFDGDGILRFTNKAYGQYFDRSSEDLAGTSMYALIPKEEREIVRANLAALASGDPVQSHEFRVIAGNGETRWMRWRDRVLFDERGEIRVYQSFGEDITEPKRAEERLRELRIYTDRLIETASVMIVSLDDEGRVVHFNPAAEVVTGYSLSEVKGLDWFSLLVPRDKYPEVHREFGRLIQGGIPRVFENPIRTKDGRERWISWSNNEIQKNGRVQGVTSFGMDISDRKLAERELMESEERFRSLMEQSPLAIEILSPDGRIRQANMAWNRLWGLNEEEAAEVHKEYNMLTDEQTVKLGVAPLIKKAFGGEPVILPPIEYKGLETLESIGIEDVNARTPWIQCHLYPVKDEQGHVKYVVNTYMEITELKKAEAKLETYQDRLRALASDLALTEERERRRVATDLHDGPAQSLALARIKLADVYDDVAGTASEKALDEASDIVRRSLEQIREVLLDLSSPSLNEIGLSAALSEWLKDQVGRKHTIKTEFVDEGAEVTLSDDLRVMLFRNARELLANIVKHARANKVSVHVKRSEETLSILVEDDGVGFDLKPVTRESLTEGGFGLFSIWESMTDLGGSLEVESSPGRGCRATLIVPLVRRTRE